MASRLASPMTVSPCPLQRRSAAGCEEEATTRPPRSGADHDRHHGEVDGDGEDVLNDGGDGTRTEGRICAEAGKQPGEKQPKDAGNRARGKEGHGYARSEPEILKREPNAEKGEKRERQADQSASCDLTHEQGAKRSHAERESAHHDGLGLSSDGIGEINERGDEEGDDDVGFESMLEAGHHGRGRSAERETHEEPW
jgi:hypothetical protein